jgi:HlyD family secretion protein
MKKRWIWIISALVITIIALLGLKKAGVIGKEESTKVSIEKVAYRTITEVVIASGKFILKVGSALTFRVRSSTDYRKG